MCFRIDVKRRREHSKQDAFIKRMNDVVRSYVDYHNVLSIVWVRRNYTWAGGGET